MIIESLAIGSKLNSTFQAAECPSAGFMQGSSYSSLSLILLLCWLHMLLIDKLL